MKNFLLKSNIGRSRTFKFSKQPPTIKLLTTSQNRLFTSSIDDKEQTIKQQRIAVEEIPTMKDFLKTQQINNQHDHSHSHQESQIQPLEDESILPQYLHIEREENKNKTYFIETHGCQMNVADTEIVQSIMESAGFEHTDAMQQVSFVASKAYARKNHRNHSIKVWGGGEVSCTGL